MKATNRHIRLSREVGRWNSMNMLVGLVAMSLAVGACSLTSSASPNNKSAAPSDVPSALRTGAATCESDNSTAGIQASPTAGAEAPAVLVLADCVNGGIGLWRLDATGRWTTVGPVADGRAIARNADLITIAHAGSLETRSVSKPAGTAGTVRLTWPGSAPGAPIVSVDRSPLGSTALVAADAQGQTYAIAASDGTVSPLEGAPNWSFTPLVGWIDSDRVLVLNQGVDNTSRLLIVNSSEPSTETVRSVTDVRWFALSQDRLTVAVSKEASIYLGHVSALRVGEKPTEIGKLDPHEIAWDLALDQTGTHLAMLSGTEAADGAIENIHEVGYTLLASGWARTYDALAPFTKALGQIWLG
ncbi:MAG TPA: hypothetical protein VF361_01530 [Candidatus Limnocylindrales bacterium]|jgi:hypothetical protein